MTSLKKLQRNWESLAQEDPLWSICTDPEKRHQRWDIDEFFATGKHEINVVMEHLRNLEIPIDRSAAALDFGCGVGRLTRALAEYFPECWGVDISPTMIRLAEDFNSSYPRCRFLLSLSFCPLTSIPQENGRQSQSVEGRCRGVEEILFCVAFTQVAPAPTKR